MKYLVTGATGSFGTRAIESLLKEVNAENIVASVRDIAKADKIKSLGVEVRQADFNDYDSLVSAFKGIDRILMISTNEPVNDKRIAQHLNAINASKKERVKLLVYTSGIHDPSKPNVLSSAHIATEKALIESGTPYCILRNNLYLETEIPTIKACIAGAPIITATGNGKIGFAVRNDYADAAVSALTGEGNENKIYELAGKPITYDELAIELSSILEKTVPVQHVDDEAFAGVLKNLGMAEVLIPLFASTKADIRNGSLDVNSNDIEELLGRPVTPILDGLKSIISFIKI